MQEEMTGQEIEENNVISYWVGKYLEEKEQKEHLQDKYDNALKEYDELLQSTPANIPDCKSCEKDLMTKLAQTETKCDRLEWYYEALNKALDIKDALNKALRDENEELKNKIRILQNDR